MQMLYVSCVHHMAVLNAAFCMTCRLLMEEEYSRACHITALQVAMSVSFCLPHPVEFSAFMICSGLCACNEMLWMCRLYVSFRSKVRSRTFGCVAMGSALLCIFRSRLLVYSTGSGVNRVQVVLSGFSMRLFCFVQAKTFCCIYIFSCTRACVCECDGDVICVGHDLNRCTGWW